MSDPDSPNAGTSPLDEAHDLFLAGDTPGAMRLALALLDAGPYPLGAATLLVDLLLEVDRPIVAGEVGKSCVEGFIRRGDLPSAVASALQSARAGEKLGPLMATIAEAFGHGSTRLGDVSPAPPPLPREVTVSPTLKALDGDALHARVEGDLQTFLGRDDPAGKSAEVPRLPLFSALKPKPLARLLSVFSVRDVPAGEKVLDQGAEGSEACVVVRGMVEAVRDFETDAELRLAALGPGAIFGEMALVANAPRAASVVALESSRLLVVTRKDLEAQAKKQKIIGQELGRFCRGRMVANLVRHSAILGAVESDERPDLIARFTSTNFETGEKLLEQGVDAPGIFLIASGKVRVEAQDDDGEEIRVAELGPGDVVGEISLVLRRPATANVVAVHSTVALLLTREEFQTAIQDHPGLLNELYDLATKREDETRSVVGQEALDVEDVVLL
ncbi:MAG: cyclic nucleotide-binding domain-containing protein [Myxococcota bacterium]